MSIENEVRLIGNLGNDPETRYTQAGMAITRISLATTSRRKDRNGNQVEETQWHRVVFFGKLAEIAGEYLRKGSKVAVSGTIRYGKYEKEGVTHYTTDVACDQMKMLDGRPQDGAQRQPAPRSNARQQPTHHDGSELPRETPPMDDFADDDIPF